MKLEDQLRDLIRARFQCGELLKIERGQLTNATARARQSCQLFRHSRKREHFLGALKGWLDCGQN